jgi:hypothetical protein
MKSSQLALGLLAFAAAASRSDAGVVLALDGSRCYAGAYQCWLTGNGMVGPLSQLQAHGYTVQTTSLITSAALAGVNVCVVGELLPGTTLSAAEASALKVWVAAGGGLLYIGDNENFAKADQQAGALVGGADYGGVYPGTNYSLVIAAPTHPLISGPFGTVLSFSGLSGACFWTNLGSGAVAVCNNPDGSAALVAVSFGLGHAVLLNDAAYFCYPPVYQGSHALLWNNTLAWLDHGSANFAPFCPGDGSLATPCPCGNFGFPGYGCDNSDFTSGARLLWAGGTNPDTLVLQASGTKATAPSVLLQGDLAITAVPFGDGLRCVGGVLKRLYVKTAVGGIVTAPQAGDPSISARSAALGDPIAPGSTRYYQVYYRDLDPVYCPSPNGGTFNSSTGMSIQW